MKIQNRFLIIFIMILNMILHTSNVDALSGQGQEVNHLTKNESEEIEKLIENKMREGQIPGLSISIVRDDKIVYQRGFGYSDIDEEKPVTSKSLFELASNSKAFTALGILNLEEAGQISLNDEITKYIPWLKFKYEGKERSVTIEQILHQTSGIPSGTVDKIPISNEDNALEDTVRTLIGIELDSQPGKTFQYATINYDILGLVIEKVTGYSYETYMEEFILKPMELNDTYLFRSQDINDRITSGYKTGFLKAGLYEAPIYRGNKPAGYIISSGEDMGKWMKIQMGTMDELNFNKEIIKRSHKASPKFDLLGNEVLYAGGWFLEPGEQISHSGMNPNYSSYIVCSNKGKKEEKTGVAVLSNLSSNHVINIGLGINGILHGQDFEDYIPDGNQVLDKIALSIIFVLSILILLVLSFIIKAIRQINRKQRYFKFKGMKSSLLFTFSFLFVLGLSCFIHFMPKILLNGLSWKTSFIWIPSSIKVALYLLYASIWIIYLYLILINCFKKNQIDLKIT